MEAYVPNRKWSREQERWAYYDGTQHEKDVAVAVKWFEPSGDGETREVLLQNDV